VAILTTDPPRAGQPTVLLFRDPRADRLSQLKPSCSTGRSRRPPNLTLRRTPNKRISVSFRRSLSTSTLRPLAWHVADVHVPLKTTYKLVALRSGRDLAATSNKACRRGVLPSVRIPFFVPCERGLGNAPSTPAEINLTRRPSSKWPCPGAARARSPAGLPSARLTEKWGSSRLLR
jgi:hypothetical protein